MVRTASGSVKCFIRRFGQVAGLPFRQKTPWAKSHVYNNSDLSNETRILSLPVKHLLERTLDQQI
jgi:uncharacterized protein (DUF2132 family)